MCDDDDDDDGVLDDVDLCPTLYDPDQRDADGDGQGDACDGDDDNDGVGDDDDACSGTPQGVPLGADGCSGAQMVESRCPADGPWKNHGQYVSCVAGVSTEAANAGLLTGAQRAAILRAAAH